MIPRYALIPFSRFCLRKEGFVSLDVRMFLLLIESPQSSRTRAHSNRFDGFVW
jgi:hypothetical protein